MNTVTLLSQIQHLAAVTTVFCLVLFLFRRRRPTQIKAIHPILFGSQLAAAVFCSCLALRAGLETECALVRFWLGASGAILAVLCVLLSYRSLWYKFVEASTRPPWPAPDTSTPQPAPLPPAAPPPEKPL